MRFPNTQRVASARQWCVSSVLLLAFVADAGAAQVDLRIESESQVVGLCSTFDVWVVADISEPLVGFGFELTYDDRLFELDTFAGAPDFAAVVDYDTNLLSGLAYPAPVSGEGVLLGTATFTVLAGGTGEFGVDYLPGMPTQGFAEMSIGAFSELGSVEPASVTAALVSADGGSGSGSVPEPSTLVIMAVGGLAVVKRRRLRAADRVFKNGERGDR